jgi:hypothetical protein
MSSLEYLHDAALGAAYLPPFEASDLLIRDALEQANIYKSYRNCWQPMSKALMI